MLKFTNSRHFKIRRCQSDHFVSRFWFVFNGFFIRPFQWIRMFEIYSFLVRCSAQFLITSTCTGIQNKYLQQNTWLEHNWIWPKARQTNVLFASSSSYFSSPMTIFRWKNEKFVSTLLYLRLSFHSRLMLSFVCSFSHNTLPMCAWIRFVLLFSPHLRSSCLCFSVSNCII